MLGDSFLKYAVARHSFLTYEAFDEGRLTRRRSSIVNNSNLYELAIAKKLQVKYLFGVTSVSWNQLLHGHTQIEQIFSALFIYM